MSEATFAINGFGRIGRATFRIWWKNHQKNLDLVAINTSGSMPLKDWVHLMKYDTNYGHFDPGITFEEKQSNKEVSDENPVLGTVTIGSKKIIFTAQRDPKKLPWKKYGVNLVLESTGIFRNKEDASRHLAAGAQKVLITASGKGEGINTSVLGVNNLDKNQTIFSNASCTTNCVSPVAHIMHQTFGVKKAALTTIHSYTDNQNILDNSHRKDIRRARAAALNLIPTTTGAAKATTQIIPELKGLFDGMAIRTPTSVGSISDMVFVTGRPTTFEEVNQTFKQAAAEERWQNILAVTEEPLVSSDIVGRCESSIVDLGLTQVIGGDLVKVVSWYDNEWGYCHRLLEQLVALR
ncbi:MAG: type I glyceraldehyde-3-phosphate dehydrogenase [Patescibacteria group bacterium]|nr:type I glyceraldehyde-3-phosphate dehydrogenase [Patescibacteria group bacterium]